MIDIKEKEKCCGCSACVQICTHHCITLDEDDEGFLYPNVDKAKCVDCGLCEKVCPFINIDKPRKPTVVYAAKNKNEDVRIHSSSGGVFSLIAEKIIDEGGIVFGARWNDKWEVIHSYTDSKNDLLFFCGSKYVQSKVEDCYKQVRRFLKDGRTVLFSGTPCQIAGLRYFLGKGYDTLLTVDFVCHGVPSPGVFRWFLQEEVDKYVRGTSKDSVPYTPIHSIPKTYVHIPDGIKIKDIRFRDKRNGWKKFSFALDLTDANADGKQNFVSLSYNQDHKYTWLKGFDLYLRPSCYECCQKDLRSGSDITLADYWGIQTLYPNFDDDKGVSAVLVNTKKGYNYLEGLNASFIKTSFDDILSKNSPLVHSTALDIENRLLFYDSKSILSFEERVSAITKVPLSKRLNGLPKKVVRFLVFSLIGEKNVYKIRRWLRHEHS